MEEERRRKDIAKLVEARAEVQGKGKPYTGLQSPAPKPSPEGVRNPPVKALPLSNAHVLATFTISSICQL